jgi:pyruvate formate lyase activating enzyme
MNGKLFSLNSDKVAALQIDPIEKKPLYHFLPSSRSLSIAAMGCNFKCSFCQNHTLSQISQTADISGELITPSKIVHLAVKHGVQSISYTYTEPTIYFELMIETARLARAEGIKNVMVTNGFFSKEALQCFALYMDAANIDLKSYSEEFYRIYCKADLQPVLNSIKRAWEQGIWIELTTLLIPEINTRDGEKIIEFIINLNPDIPWHVSKFFPQFKEGNRKATGENTITNTLELAKEMGVNYLYAGNVGNMDWENTYCPRCKSLLIQRSGYQAKIKGMSGDKCSNCQTKIAGVW